MITLYSDSLYSFYVQYDNYVNDISVIRYQPETGRTALLSSGAWILVDGCNFWPEGVDVQTYFMPGLWMFDVISETFCCMTVQESKRVFGRRVACVRQ